MSYPSLAIDSALPLLCSGIGQFHSNEPTAKNPTPYTSLSFDDVKSMVDNPQSVDKSQAKWLIPSSLPSRNFKAQEQDGKFWLLWVDIDKNPHGLTKISEIVTKAVGGSDYEIYTSRSATAENMKCRVLIPLDNPLTGQDWVIVQELLNNHFEDNGMEPDRASERPAQLLYLPNRGDVYDTISQRSGLYFNPLRTWARAINEREKELIVAEQELEAAKQQAMAKKAARASFDNISLIDAFNEQYPIQDILIQAGYSQRGNSFRHPHSETGNYSATVKDGRVNPLSSSDPLFKYRNGDGAHDAFSAFVAIFHKGDQAKALKAAGNNWLAIGSETFNQYQQRVWKEAKATTSPKQSPITQQPMAKENNVIELPRVTNDDEILAKIIAIDAKQATENKENGTKIKAVFSHEHMLFMAAQNADLTPVWNEKLLAIVRTAGLKTHIEKLSTKYRKEQAELARLAAIEEKQARRTAVAERLDNGEFYPLNKPIISNDWPDWSRDGKKLATLNNFEFMAKHYGITFFSDTIKNSRVITIPNQELDDNATLAMLSQLCALNELPEKAVNTASILFSKNERNPVLEVIESKPWDGIDRLEAFYSTVTVEQGNERYRDLGLRMWLTQCVAAADYAERSPIENKFSKFEMILIFQSAQGLSKTSFFNRLMPKGLSDYFSDGISLDLKNKDSITEARSFWIVELGELDSTFKKSEIAELKAFLSKQFDKIRLPYDRCHVTMKRTTSFCGSVNDERFLGDDTGARRMLPMAVTKLNAKHNIDMQQLWAQVFHLYRNGEQWWPNAELLSLMAGNHEKHQLLDPVEDAIRTYFKLGDTSGEGNIKRFSCTQIAEHCGIKNVSKAVINKIGALMKKNGHRPVPDSGRKYYVLTAHNALDGGYMPTKVHTVNDSYAVLELPNSPCSNKPQKH